MSDAIKNLKKTLAKRPDVDADFERLGRPIKDAGQIRAAVDEGFPAALAELYAGCNGLHVGWSFVGYDADDGDARGLLGGQARLLELGKCRWHDFGEHRLLRLEDSWENRGLLILRTADGKMRTIHAETALREADELESVIELGAPDEFFPRWVELGLPHPSIWSTPMLEQQRARLAKKAIKRKVEVGARVWPHKAKGHDMNGTVRGRVDAIEAGSNGKRYAEVAWDDGCSSWIRVDLLAALGSDRYESAAAEPTSVDGLSPLLLWLSTNINSECFVGTDAEAREYLVARESWWLAKLLAATPLEDLIAATAAWVEAREVPTPADYQREKDEELYVPGPDEVVEPAMMCFDRRHLASSFGVRRAARALTDAVIIRWLRERDEQAPKALVELDARVGSPYRDEDQPGSLGDELGKPDKRRVVPRLDVDDEFARGKALGLAGPVRYTHD